MRYSYIYIYIYYEILINTPQLQSYRDKNFMTRSDVTMNELAPMRSTTCRKHFCSCHVIVANWKDLQSPRQNLNHIKSRQLVLVGQHMPWNCFHATPIKQSPKQWWPDPVPVVLSAVSLHPGRSSHGHRRWHNPKHQLSSDQTHKGSTRDCRAFVSCRREPPLWEVVETWGFWRQGMEVHCPNYSDVNRRQPKLRPKFWK